MTDSGKIFVSFSEFASYLKKVNAFYTCPMCRNNQWTLITPDSSLRNGQQANIIPTLPVTDLQNEGGIFFHSKTHNLLIVECKSCGYISFFNHNTVLKKLRIMNLLPKEGSKEKMRDED